MSTTKSLTTLLIISVFASVVTSAQSFENRHQIELRMGGWSQVTDTRTAVGIGGVTTTVASNGFIGGIAYGHWLEEELAFRISAGLMAASIDVEASASGVATNFAAVMPVLFGLRYYFPKSTYGGQFRPFAGAGVGTLIGSHEIVQTGMTVVAETRTEAALGGEVEAGVSIVLSKHVLATFAGAYSLMTDFDQPIGGSRNYSGPQLTLGISLLLGGDKGGN